MRKNLKNKVSLLRQQHGYTQEDLADFIGVSRQTIIALEKGNYAPSVILALKIAMVFQLSVEEVFSLS
jgi:putative transcriptional regulator